ncbi:MAG: glutathione transferase GstA [Janthinobacterium lividum]
MKLYFSPGTCSLSPHIALLEAGIAFESVLASTKTHKLPDGTDFYTLNPLGYVPLLELDDGTLLREGQVIVQYIADQAPLKNLAPANGTLPRYRLQEWLAFIGTEIHKNFGPLFGSAMPTEIKVSFKDKLRSRFSYVDEQLAGKQFVTGEHFTVADCYLFTVTGWAKPTGVDLSGFANLLAWQARIAERPAVKEAIAAEKPSA